MRTMLSEVAHPFLAILAVFPLKRQANTLVLCTAG